MNIVKNETNCIPEYYNCNPLPVNLTATVGMYTQAVPLSHGCRIQAHNRVYDIAIIATSAKIIWRFVLNIPYQALIVITIAENEVNRLTNPCITCIIYIVFTYRFEWNYGEFLIRCRLDLLMVTSFLHTGWRNRHPVFFGGQRPRVLI